MSLIIHDYDAAKRREYYLKNRKLKGRTHKAVPPVKHPKKTRAQHQKELQARIDALQARLTTMRAAIKKLVEAAQARSGVAKNSAEKDAATKKYQNSKSDPTSKYEKKTASEKAAAAKASEKYRDENSKLADQVKSLQEQIETARKRIATLKEQAGSVGARKSTTK